MADTASATVPRKSGRPLFFWVANRQAIGFPLGGASGRQGESDLFPESLLPHGSDGQDQDHGAGGGMNREARKT